MEDDAEQIHAHFSVSALGIFLPAGTGLLIGLPTDCADLMGAAIDPCGAKGSAYYDYAIALDPMSVLVRSPGYRPWTATSARSSGACWVSQQRSKRPETFEDPPMVPDADPYALMDHVMFLDHGSPRPSERLR